MRSVSTIIFTIILATLVSGFGCGKDSGISTSSFPSASGTGKAGSLARFAIVNNHLYALDGNEIVCYDISNSNSPILRNRVKVAFDIETIYPYEDKLFIGSTTGMYSYSLAEPGLPKFISVVTHVRACDPVVVQGQYAYVTLRGGTACGGSNVLNVYNIANINNPSLIKTINVNAPYGLGIAGNALYVTNPAGIKSFNITQQDNPVFVSDIAEPTASDVIPNNNTMIVQLKKGAAFYDISNALAPSFLSRITQ